MLNSGWLKTKCINMSQMRSAKNSSFDKNINPKHDGLERGDPLRKANGEEIMFSIQNAPCWSTFSDGLWV